jgi:hypothetical protein
LTFDGVTATNGFQPLYLILLLPIMAAAGSDLTAYVEWVRLASAAPSARRAAALGVVSADAWRFRGPVSMAAVCVRSRRERAKARSFRSRSVRPTPRACGPTRARGCTGSARPGRRVSRKRVARLMRELGLVGRPRRRFRPATDSRLRWPRTC